MMLLHVWYKIASRKRYLLCVFDSYLLDHLEVAAGVILVGVEQVRFPLVFELRLHTRIALCLRCSHAHVQSLSWQMQIIVSHHTYENGATYEKWRHFQPKNRQRWVSLRTKTSSATAYGSAGWLLSDAAAAA